MDDEGLVVEVVTPKLEGLNEAQKLLVVDGVGLLGILVFGGVVGDDAFVGAVSLGKDGPGGEEGGVSVEVEGGRVVGGGEDGGGGKGSLENGEGGDGIVRPRGSPVGAFLEPVVEGGGDGGIALYKSTVVVGQAEEGTKVGEGGGERPVGDGGDFGGVGRDAVAGNDMTAEINLGLGKVAFPNVGVQLVVT